MMYILSYLLFSLIIIIISFRNIADLQEDKQLLSGNNNGESNSNTDLLQLEQKIRSATNKTYWDNWGSEKHMEKKRKKNQSLSLASKINDGEDSPLLHRQVIIM